MRSKGFSFLGAFVLLASFVGLYGCGGTSPTSPSPSAGNAVVQAPPTINPVCAAIDGEIGVNGQELSIVVTEPALVEVFRLQDNRRELDGSLQVAGPDVWRPQVHYGFDYVVKATCANGATQEKGAHVDKENVCGACANQPIPPPPAPVVQTAQCNSTDVVVDPWKFEDDNAARTSVHIRSGLDGSVTLFVTSYGRLGSGILKRIHQNLPFTLVADVPTYVSIHSIGTLYPDGFVMVACSEGADELVSRPADAISWEPIP